MKIKNLLIIFIFALLLLSCEYDDKHFYYKCFFIAETSFEIEGEVFVNNNMTEKVELEKIVLKIDSIDNWEIIGNKISDNKFNLLVDINANGTIISKETIDRKKEGEYHFSKLFPDDFSYCTLVFHINGRRARGATEPEFGTLYYYVYVTEPIDLSGEKSGDGSDKFGNRTNFYHYDLDFFKPGWYKIYNSENKSIEDKSKFSSPANTKIRAAK